MALAVSVLTTAMLSGCGSTVKGVEVDLENIPTYADLAAKTYEDDAYVQNLNVDKYVKLSNYKDLEVSVQEVYVDEAEVESYIERKLTSNPFKVEITDRAVEDGDTVNIDYIGLYQGGVEFEGGTAQDQELVIGSNTFIDGFEDGVIGMEIGEVKHLELTFPEEYHAEELAGQDVVFVVTLNNITAEEPAELNDEWVATLAIEGVNTVDAYREYVYNLYLESDQSRFTNEVQNTLLRQVVENSEFTGDYTPVWQRYFDLTLLNVQYQTSYYGFDLETFAMLSGGMEMEAFMNEMLASAEAGAKEILTVTAIAKAEGLEVTDEDIQAEIEVLAAAYGFASADEYLAAAGDPTGNIDFMEMVLTSKVLKFLEENAVVTETEYVAETE